MRTSTIRHRALFERGPGGGFGVDGVGPAVSAAPLTVRAVHLDNRDAFAGQVAGQAGAVAAGALDADPSDPAVGVDASRDLPVVIVHAEPRLPVRELGWVAPPAGTTDKTSTGEQPSSS